MSDSPTHRTRLGAAAGLVGATAALTLVLGVGPGPSVFQLAGANEDVSGNCDEAEHAGDPACVGVVPDSSTSTTLDDSSTSTTVTDDTTSTTTGTPADPATSVRSIDAAGAGTVVVAVESGTLRLVTATPRSGWRVEVEQGSGREIEVDFRSGTKRVQVTVELEDGQVRERVRTRDDVDGTDVRIENGTVVRDDSDDRGDDSSGHGGGDDDSIDDSSGGHGSDDSGDDDRSGSGHGGEDDAGDDHGGSGHGSDDD